MNVTLLEISIGFLLIAMNEWYSNQNHHCASWLKPICFFGKKSYKVYLTHVFIILFMAKIILHSTTAILIEYAAILILCAIVGRGVSTYFSEPMNKLLRRKNYLKIKRDKAECVKY